MDTTDESEIRQRRAEWKAAFEAGDVDRIMSFYAPGAATVAFDILPPLQYAGWGNYKRDWASFLKLFDGPCKVMTQDIQILCSGDLAVVHGFVQLVGVIKGRPFQLWMRATNALTRIDGVWLVVHDHVSVPVDITTGRSAMDLIP